MSNASDWALEPQDLPPRCDTIPAPPPSVFDDAPPWAKALFASSEETRAALVELGDKMVGLDATMRRLTYRMGALSIAMGLQEHRTREVEARVAEARSANVVPLRGV
jgi:hypothetical protein